MSENIIKRIVSPSVRGRVWQYLIAIIILVAIGGLIDAGSYYNKGADWVALKTNNTVKLPHTTEIPFHLGLDLLGGSHLVYKADMSQVANEDQGSALEGVRDVIERRVNVFGVSEPIVQTSISSGEPRVIVELAGIKDVNEAIKMIGETPLLEFKEEDTELRTLTDEERTRLDEFNTEAKKKADEVLEKISTGDDFAELAKTYSDDSATKDNGGQIGWITDKDNPELANIARGLSVGDATKDLITRSNGYEILKLDDKNIKTNPFNENEVEKEVNASHILICHNEVEGCTNDKSKEEVYSEIKKIKEEATPQNFADLARKYSTDPSASNGGDLGWFGKGVMVKPFEDTVFSQEVGSVSWVVETQFGYHLIYKAAERPIEEFKMSRIFIRTLTEADIIGDQNKWKNTKLTGKDLEKATVQFDPNDNSPLVGLKFNDEGTKLFAEITERNVGKRLAIFLDGQSIVDVNGDGVISEGEVYAPTVNEAITSGQAVISGLESVLKAKELTRRLNAGALPVPIELINQQTVGASLGKASLEASLKAGLLGLILVALFMLVYYRVSGISAIISLIFYGVFVLAVFKSSPFWFAVILSLSIMYLLSKTLNELNLLDSSTFIIIAIMALFFFVFAQKSVTLTLSGFAGFILSIGMAVDANVLIFERLKEELRSGRPLSLAISEAFTRAWPSIFDGNVSTLITCFILATFSTSIVKGFAITLGLGVIVSMFSAVAVTKILLTLSAGKWLENKLWLLGVKK